MIDTLLISSTRRGTDRRPAGGMWGRTTVHPAGFTPINLCHVFVNTLHVIVATGRFDHAHPNSSQRARKCEETLWLKIPHKAIIKYQSHTKVTPPGPRQNLKPEPGVDRVVHRRR